MEQNQLKLFSHDLRNHLAAAQSWADLLAEDSRIPEDLAQHTLIIRTRIREAALMVAAVSDLFRETTPHTVPGVRGAEVWANWCLRSPFSKGVEWREDLEPNTLVPVSGDKLQMVFTHLARNVTRFCSRNPAAKVSLRTLPVGSVLSISDEGPGSPEARCELLGVPFGAYPAPDGTKPGTGLGLAHVRRITEEAGGTFCVSTTTGKGFTVTLKFQKSNQNS